MRSTNACRYFSGLATMACGAFALLATPSSAQELLSSAPFKGALTTLGIIAPDRDPIEYHERAPLVVPKSLDLPAPAATQARARNPDWPVDPDVAQKAKEKAEAAEPVTHNQGSRNANNPLLPIASMLGIKSSSDPIQQPGPVDEHHNRETGFIPSAVVRSQGEQFAARNYDPDKNDNIRPGFEPKRRYLTDPPSGYRMPSSKAKFKPQYAPPVKKTEERNGQEFLREQYLRSQGTSDPNKED